MSVTPTATKILVILQYGNSHPTLHGILDGVISHFVIKTATYTYQFHMQIGQTFSHCFHCFRHITVIVLIIYKLLHPTCYQC